MPGSDNPAVAVIGPTGSGKSRLGLALAIRFRGEIISCDALQIYRNMDVGTAKASPGERDAVTHHMLDLRNPSDYFSAGDYQRLARQALNEVRRREHLPFVVGGSGFYLRALIEGLFEGPGREEEVRSRLRRIIARKGVERLHKVLRGADPEAAARIRTTDEARIIRALEVCRRTGKPMSWWQSRPRDALHGFRWLKMGIALPRQELYRRINIRVEQMIEAGFVEEVRSLLQQCPREGQALKAIGYGQIADHLEGRKSLPQAIEDIQRETRRYAKRQLTWFRRDPAIVWFDGSDWDELLRRTGQLVDQFLQQA